MIETTGFAIAALMYSLIVSSGSMATAAYCNRIDHLSLGHLLVLVVWCGGGIGLLAFAKQTLSKPAFNTACSLACMAISVNLVRDGFSTLRWESNNRKCPDSPIQRRIHIENPKNRLDWCRDL
jgi:hypothetical protein